MSFEFENFFLRPKTNRCLSFSWFLIKRCLIQKYQEIKAKILSPSQIDQQTDLSTIQELLSTTKNNLLITQTISIAILSWIISSGLLIIPVAWSSSYQWGKWSTKFNFFRCYSSILSNVYSDHFFVDFFCSFVCYLEIFLNIFSQLG
jgi:hypothetical protein